MDKRGGRRGRIRPAWCIGRKIERKRGLAALLWEGFILFSERSKVVIFTTLTLMVFSHI